MEFYPAAPTHLTRRDSLTALIKALTVALSLCILVSSLVYTFARYTRPSTPIVFSSPQLKIDPIATIAYTSAKNPDLGDYLVPLITMPVTINQTSQNITFLIDTGAIITALPMDYASSTGINLAELKRMLLASLTSQTIFGYITTMDAQVNGHTLKLPVSFAPIDTPVLGRYGFLDTYTLVFDHQQQAVIIANSPL